MIIKRFWHFYVLLLAAFLLTACADPIETDLRKVAKIIDNSVISEQDWQTRAQNAKTEAEQKALATELESAFSELHNHLEQLSLKTPEVEEIRQKLSSGTQRFASSMGSILHIETLPEDEQMTVLQNMIQGQQEIMESMQRFQALAKERGIWKEKAQ